MRYVLRHADSFAAVFWSNSGQRMTLTRKTLRSTLPSRPWNRASLTLPLFFSFSFLLFSFFLSHLFIFPLIFSVNRCPPAWTQLRGPNRALSKNYNIYMRYLDPPYSIYPVISSWRLQDYACNILA